MKRAEFLQKKWQRYPAFSKGFSFIGRVHDIIPHIGQWQVTLIRDGKPQRRVFPKLILKDSENTEAELILAIGDLVAISDGGIVALLAPQLTKLPPRTLRTESLKLWQEYLYWVRRFFSEGQFTEIATPHLVSCPGTEASLDVFSTEFVYGRQQKTFYLPTSPELHLKKALALGAEKIFEIKTCFRNGEITEIHQPEFTMIEWYRAYENLQAIQRDVADLVTYLLRKIPSFKSPVSFENLSMAALFQAHCGFAMTPQTSLDELKTLAQGLKLRIPPNASIDDVFFLIFLEKIESQLPSDALCFVEKYPPYQAALARLTDDGWGDRFEVYWQGLEIANAFHELNDPEIQRQRFQEDLAKKKTLGKEEIPLDPEFLQCLEAGMPPSAGIALGLERLFMALTGVGRLADLRLFPLGNL